MAEYRCNAGHILSPESDEARRRDYDALRAENERLRAALTELHRTSQLCWDDDSDETPGHTRDPWLWAEWINAIEAAAPLVKTNAQP